MIIDDYFTSVERGLRQNAQVSEIEEPLKILTHPHHKHIGPADRLAPADQPSLSQVLAEVESWLRR